jgi:plastocyanin
MRTVRMLAVVSLVVLVLAACGSDDSSDDEAERTTTTAATTTTDGDTGAGDGNVITIKDTAFSPQTLRVEAGSAVRIENEDAGTHTWTADEGSDGHFDEELGGGDSASQVFADAGTFPYHCEIHSSMTGTVVVE